MRLLAITDRALLGRDPLAKIAGLMERLGPRVIVQIREKDLPARELYEWTAVLSIRARSSGASLYVNGRADVVRCFAPNVGLHLPEDGLKLGDARAFLPPGTPIGRSIHSVEDAGDADLHTIAPIFATPSKPGATPLGLAKLAAAAKRIPNLYALGGIDRENAEAVRATGVSGIAAIRAAWSDGAAQLLGLS